MYLKRYRWDWDTQKISELLQNTEWVNICGSFFKTYLDNQQAVFLFTIKEEIVHGVFLEARVSPFL